jgi:hypothetical protein
VPTQPRAGPDSEAHNAAQELKKSLAGNCRYTPLVIAMGGRSREQLEVHEGISKRTQLLQCKMTLNLCLRGGATPSWVGD